MLLNVILNLDKDLLTHVQLLTAESSKARRRKTEVMWYTNLLDLVYPNYFFYKERDWTSVCTRSMVRPKCYFCNLLV